MASVTDEADSREETGVARKVMESKRYILWTLDLEQKLLTLWRSRRCLFDPNSFDTKYEKQEALVELAAELCVTEEDLLKHMTSLRTQYSRCMRIGSAAARTPRQKWLVRELGFLKPYIKTRVRPLTGRRATHHYRQHTSRQVSYATHEKFVDESLTGDVDSPAVVVDDVETTSPSIDLELVAADETLEVDDDGQSALVTDDGVIEWQDVVAQETTSTAADGRRLERGDADVDGDAVFGQLVVCELRHVTDPATKLVLRHNILTMIYEARLGCLQGTRSGLPHTGPPRRVVVDQGSRRPTINGCWSFSRSAHDDIDAANEVHRRQNCADDETIVIKEEVE